MADDVLAGALKPPVARLAQTPMPPRVPVNPTDQAYSNVDAANKKVAEAESATGFLKGKQEELQASQQGRMAGGLEEAQRAGTEAMRPVQDELHDIDMQAAKARFEPSKRNIEENIALFSLINVVGFAIGAGGKNHSQQAMAALNGMSEGVNKGDINRYKQEKSTFDTNLNALAKKANMLSNELQKISVLSTRDNEEAQLKLQSLFAREHADFLKQYTEQRGLAAGLAYAQQTAKAAQSALERQKTHDMREQEARDRILFAAANRQPREPHVIGQTPEGYGVYLVDGNEVVGKTKLTLKGKGTTGATGGLSSVIRDATGLDLPAKDAAVVQSNVQGIRTIEGLQRELQDPEVTKGLKAKAASFFEKLSSLPDSTDFETAANTQLTDTDKTTLFLKKAMLSAYAIERAATGGQRVTVQMMRQVGPVLDPTNYTGPAFNQLLDDRRQDLYSTLHDYGLRPQDIKTLSAQIPYTPYLEKQTQVKEPSAAKPVPSAVNPSVSEKQDALPNEVVHADAKGNKAVLRNGGWVEVK